MKTPWQKSLVLLVLALCACDDVHMPHLDLFGPNYKPMTYDVAQMAAPASPDAQAAGPVVHCRVSKGSARFTNDNWADFRTEDFTVNAAARATVTLSPEHGAQELSFQAWFDGPGQKMIFCPVADGPPDKKISCASVYMLDDDLDDGIKRTFDIPNAVQGGVITCAHDVGKLQK